MHNTVSWDDVVAQLVMWVAALLGLAVSVLEHMFPLWRMLLVVLVVLVLLLTLQRYGHPPTNYTHMHNTITFGWQYYPVFKILQCLFMFVWLSVCSYIN